MQEVMVFLDEDDKYHDRSLHEHIMQYLIHHGIAGATIVSAFGGYGRKKHLQYPKKFGTTDEAPLIILFVDEKAKVATVLPHLKDIVQEGLITIKEVHRA